MAEQQLPQLSCGSARSGLPSAQRSLIPGGGPVIPLRHGHTTRQKYANDAIKPSSQQLGGPDDAEARGNRGEVCLPRHHCPQAKTQPLDTTCDHTQHSPLLIQPISRKYASRAISTPMSYSAAEPVATTAPIRPSLVRTVHSEHPAKPDSRTVESSVTSRAPSRSQYPLVTWGNKHAAPPLLAPLPTIQPTQLTKPRSAAAASARRPPQYLQIQSSTPYSSISNRPEQ